VSVSEILKDRNCCYSRTRSKERV